MNSKDLTSADKCTPENTSNTTNCKDNGESIPLSKVGSRHASREAAFALVFEKSFKECTVSELLGIDDERESPDKYMLDVIYFLDQRLEYIDKLISLYSKKWEISRLSKVSLAVLRLAVSEIELGKEPQAVIINEAVELAKLYGSEDDASYINGVLGGYVRDENRKSN